jgi:hypothetical protein
MNVRRWAILVVILVLLVLCCLARSDGATNRPEGMTLKEWAATEQKATVFLAETPVFGIACFELPCDLAPILGEVDVSGPGLPVKPYCREKRKPP